LPKIFEPYFTTKHQSQGTGLGLHMSYNLITKSMKGQIKAQNISFEFNHKEYHGAQFTITIPLEQS
jgi:signal transduction histidine kinase